MAVIESIPRVAYVAAFGAAVLACLAAARLAGRIDHPDTRRGLVWLSLISGAWAAAHVGYFVAPTDDLQIAAYVAGLTAGFAAVGPWLYFCSAFTGRSLHRNTRLRQLAVASFLAVVAVKLTNPLHGLYFSTEVVQQPFHHVAVQLGLLHYVVMGLAYALATIGYFMLLELFVQVDHDVRPILLLVAITALPLGLDIVGFASPLLVDVTYEPLGVAVFAVGVVTVYHDQFRAIRVAGSHDEPVIVLDSADRIRNVNRRARELFPCLVGRDVLGERLVDVLPAVAAARDAEPPVVTRERGGATRYYRVTTTEFSTSSSRLGALLAFTDVTGGEQYRRELEAKNRRLEEFARVVSHDLRNPLNVAKGRLELARERHEDDGDLASAVDSLDRMEELVDDLLALARQGRSIDETETVSLAAAARRSWGMVDAPEATLVVEGDRRFEADPERLGQLFENLFRNAVEHGGDGVTVTVSPAEDGFAVADDGPGIAPGDREDVFESGYTTAENGTGFGLAIVTEIVEAHGWSIGLEESESGGARFVVAGVGGERVAGDAAGQSGGQRANS